MINPHFTVRTALELSFPCLPPGLNGGPSRKHPERKAGLLRMHWSERKELNDFWVTMVRGAIPPEIWDKIGSHGPLFSMLHPVEVLATRYDVHLMDWDNYGASLKPVLDGLVKTGILSDDSPKVITLLTLDQRVIRPGTPERLTLEFIVCEGNV